MARIGHVLWKGSPDEEYAFRMRATKGVIRRLWKMKVDMGFARLVDALDYALRRCGY